MPIIAQSAHCVKPAPTAPAYPPRGKLLSRELPVQLPICEAQGQSTLVIPDKACPRAHGGLAPGQAWAGNPLPGSTVLASNSPMVSIATGIDARSVQLEMVVPVGWVHCWTPFGSIYVDQILIADDLVNLVANASGFSTEPEIDTLPRQFWLPVASAVSWMVEKMVSCSSDPARP